MMPPGRRTRKRRERELRASAQRPGLHQALQGQIPVVAGVDDGQRLDLRSDLGTMPGLTEAADLLRERFGVGAKIQGPSHHDVANGNWGQGFLRRSRPYILLAGNSRDTPGGVNDLTSTRFLISLHVAVQANHQARILVTKPAGDGEHIDASGDKSGCVEVPKIVGAP
jgi:hypothetical protein